MVSGSGALAGEAVMANGRIYAERWRFRRVTARGLLLRRALVLIVMGLALVFLAGVNLDLFEATVGSIAAAAGAVWFWFLCRSRRAGGANVPSDPIVRPATRRDPHFQ